MKRPPRLLLRLVVPGALVLLVATLAALQYRWLGQVSDAERDRRHTWLTQHAQELADDFDLELLRVYVALQGAGEAALRRDAERFAAQYDRWRDNAPFPQIVRAVYLTGPPQDGPNLTRFDPAARAFAAAPWPASLTPVQKQLYPPPAPPPPRPLAGSDDQYRLSQEARALIASLDPFLPSVPALLISMPLVSSETTIDASQSVSVVRMGGGHIIVELDREQIRDTLVPALVARRFPERDADEFRFALIDPARPADPIYTRGIEKGQTLDPAGADARVPIFTLRLELATATFVRPLVAEGGKMPASAGAAGQMFTIRENVNAVAAPRRVSPVDQPSAGARPAAPITAKAVGGSGSTPPRVGGFARATGAPSGPANMSIVVQSTGRAERTSVLATRRPSWQLVFQHTAGSLDEAVAQARRRNLWLSFSILGVLGAGVILVVVNAQRSQRLAAQQMDFVATVSHELRTPLTVIRSAAQNLSAGVVHDPSQARQYGDLIETEGRRLTDMVEQVLEYAGLSGNRRPPLSRPIDAGALVGDVVTSCGALFDAAGITPDVSIEPHLPPVVADEPALRRALHNLIANALKHGADGGAVSIAVTRAPTARQHVDITVADRGRGIEPADLPHVFEPFYRGRYALERQIQGNGLGLSLVKRIAEAHGGQISVTSTAGQGAAFTLHLPAAPDAVAASPLPDAAAEPDASTT